MVVQLIMAYILWPITKPIDNSSLVASIKQSFHDQQLEAQQSTPKSDEEPIDLFEIEDEEGEVEVFHNQLSRPIMRRPKRLGTIPEEETVYDTDDELDMRIQC